MHNLYLGDNELRLIATHGYYSVIEEWENWKIVFQGGYNECLAYMENRYTDYLISLIG